MRFLPLITAVVVAAVLYLFVIERDRLFEWVGLNTPDVSTPEDTSETASDVQEDLPAGTVRVMARASQARDVESAVIVRGETEALRQVAVMAETTGPVISEPLRSGATVSAGDLLCQIDPGTTSAGMDVARAQVAEIIARRPETEARIPEAEAQVLGARAALEEAKINADNAIKLSERGFSSNVTVASTNASVAAAEAQVISAEAGVKSARAGIDALDAALESAQSVLAEAEKDIERLAITAPFSGLLETDAAELGSFLQPGTACATVIQLDPIKIVGYVPEIDVSRIEPGAMAGARLIDGRQVSGQVSFVGRSADEQTRTFRVELLVENEDLSIRDGQTAEIIISTEGKKAHLLPQSALTLNNEGELGVRLVSDDNTALWQSVSILRDTQDGVWLDGLPEQANVILLGQEYVTSGVPVAPSYEEITQ